jgi:hypothetical protein
VKDLAVEEERKKAAHQATGISNQANGWANKPRDDRKEVPAQFEFFLKHQIKSRRVGFGMPQSAGLALPPQRQAELTKKQISPTEKGSLIPMLT